MTESCFTRKQQRSLGHPQCVRDTERAVAVGRLAPARTDRRRLLLQRSECVAQPLLGWAVVETRVPDHEVVKRFEFDGGCDDGEPDHRRNRASMEARGVERPPVTKRSGPCGGRAPPQHSRERDIAAR